MKLRTVTVDDAPVLWEMLTYAASMSPGGPASVAEAKADPLLSWYVAGWGRPGDLGLRADDEDGRPLGAAWLRLLDGPAVASKVATPFEPELAIGVIPEARGRGIGAALLRQLVGECRGRYEAIVLTVRETNPSVRLYLREGFVETGRVINRVGSSSLAMRREIR